MSVGVPSDIGQAPAGFDGAATSSMPGQGQPDQLPTGTTDAALTGQGTMPAPASEGVEPLDLTDEDRAWLSSEPVLNYLRENLPQGFMTEEQFRQHLSAAQSTTQRELAEAQRQAAYYQGQFEEHRLTAEQMAQALQNAWREAGIEYGSEEWNQRTQALRGSLDGIRREREHEQLTYESTMNKVAAETTQEFQADLNLLGMAFNDPWIVRAYTEHMTRLRSGAYQTPTQISQDRRSLLAWAKEQSRAQRAPAQQQAQAQPHPQTQIQAQQPAAQTRPAGATRSARGGGGATPRTYKEFFDTKYQELIQQYGGEEKIPLKAVTDLDIEAATQTHGL